MINKGLLSWLSKKKLTDEKVANIFVNSSFETVEKGWPEIAAMINASPEFDTSPDLDEKDYGRFLIIVVSANLSLVPKFFKPGVDRAIIKRCCAKFGLALGVPKKDTPGNLTVIRNPAETIGISTFYADWARAA